ncbi:MAG: ABC transporter permease [Rhodobacterales bacterium]|nr:ABC transporter permease [Rhodobacterales bacterium]
MRYALKIATRYLTASKAQTLLLVLGVAVGVFIFIFMSALIGGLAEFLLARIAGDLSHVTIEAKVLDPAVLVPAGPGLVLTVTERPREKTANLANAASLVPIIESLPGVIAVSPQINGSGFLTKGAQVAQVAINGIEPGLESSILNLQGYIVEGSADLAVGRIILGRGLTDDLSLRLGQTVRLQSTEGIEALLTLTGILETGSDATDKRTAYVSIGTARTMFEMPQGVTRIEIKLGDIYAADAAAVRISAATGLTATSWTTQAAQLMDALKAQSQTGILLKTFAMITIIIGVASALLLSTYRRRPEIGIMRAMGAERGFVVFVFVLQGGLIGLLGGLSGALIGYLALLPFPTREHFQSGSLPLDITQGSYGAAILLTLAGAILASIVPARAAARVDPVTAIGQ